MMVFLSFVAILYVVIGPDVNCLVSRPVFLYVICQGVAWFVWVFSTSVRKRRNIAIAQIFQIDLVKYIMLYYVFS